MIKNYQKKLINHVWTWIEWLTIKLNKKKNKKKLIENWDLRVRLNGLIIARSNGQRGKNAAVQCHFPWTRIGGPLLLLLLRATAHALAPFATATDLILSAFLSVFFFSFVWVFFFIFRVFFNDYWFFFDFFRFFFIDLFNFI